MELTKEQKKFLDKVCYGGWELNSNGEVDVDGKVSMIEMNLNQIPVKFGNVSGYFDCSYNQLTSLEFCPSKVGGGFYCWDNKLTSLEFAPTSVGENFYCSNNRLTDYFKNIKEEDFLHWDELDWHDILREYPYLINIGKKYLSKSDLKYYLNKFPQTKLYLE